MAFAAATPEQSKLVQRVILKIENNPKHMERLSRNLTFAHQKRLPGPAFRSLVRPMLFEFWPLHYPPTEDSFFCMAWLWINTMGQSADDFFQSNILATQRRLDNLFSQCCTSEVIMPVSSVQEDAPISAPAPAFETRHYVYGCDVAKMSTEQLITAIKQVEREIEELCAVKVKSTFITKKIAELLNMRAEIVERLDAR